MTTGDPEDATPMMPKNTPRRDFLKAAPVADGRRIVYNMSVCAVLFLPLAILGRNGGSFLWSDTMKGILVETSPGELIDKITILRTKAQRITDAEKLENVSIELAALTERQHACLPVSARLAELTAELQRTNEALWDIEDEIRRCEARQDFGERFVELARSVYRTNDRRAAAKRAINDLLGSRLVEEKQYVAYDRHPRDCSY